MDVNVCERYIDLDIGEDDLEMSSGNEDDFFKDFHDFSLICFGSEDTQSSQVELGNIISRDGGAPPNSLRHHRFWRGLEAGLEPNKSKKVAAREG